MADILIEMVQSRETKNNVLYVAEDDSKGVENLYIKKAALSRPFPGRVSVVVSIPDTQ